MKTLDLPADVAGQCQEAADVLRSNIGTLGTFMIASIGDDGDDTEDLENWMVSVRHGEIVALMRNLSAASDLFAALAKLSAGEAA